MTSDGKHGFICGTPPWLRARPPAGTCPPLYSSPQARFAVGGSHPTAPTGANRDNSRLFVALTDRDEIAVLSTTTGKPLSLSFNQAPRARYGGSDPEYLALTPNKTLFFRQRHFHSHPPFSISANCSSDHQVFRSYPVVSHRPSPAATGKDLLIASAEGRGSGIRRPSARPRRSASAIPTGRAHQWFTRACGFAAESLCLYEAGFRNRRHTHVFLRRRRQSGASSTSLKKIAPTTRSSAISTLAMAIHPWRCIGEDITPNQHKLAVDSASSTISMTVETFPATATCGPLPPGSIAKNLAEDRLPRLQTNSTIPKALYLAASPPKMSFPTRASRPWYVWKNFATHGISLHYRRIHR